MLGVSAKIDRLLQEADATFKDFGEHKPEKYKPVPPESVKVKPGQTQPSQPTPQSNAAAYTGIGLGTLGTGLGGTALYNTLENHHRIRRQGRDLNHLDSRVDDNIETNDKINLAQNNAISRTSELARDAGEGNTPWLRSFDNAQEGIDDLLPRINGYTFDHAWHW